MNNGMDSMLDTYLYETELLMDQLDEILVNDEKEGDFPSDDVNEIFRIMHTIKGSSAMMEFTPLATIAHRMEDLFFYIRDKGMDSLSSEIKQDLFDLMFRSEDQLRADVEKVKAGTPLGDDSGPLITEIETFLAKISSGEKGGAAAPEAKPDAQAPAEAQAPAAEGVSLPDDPDAVCFIHVFLEDGVGMENLRAFIIINAVRECDITTREYPRDIETNPDTCSEIIENGFFLAFDSAEAAEQASGVLQSQSYIRSYELLNKPEPAAAPAPEEAKEAEAPKAAESKQAEAPKGKAAAHPAGEGSGAPVKQNLISVNLQKLDDLINIVGEIVITESMVSSSPELSHLPSGSFDNFMKSARQLRKLTSDLQDVALSLRMVPISGVFQKMNRIVRDMCRKLDKDVRLTIIGEDTEVDKTVIDGIQDPIMHMVRNCMDHGIEDDVNDRLALGKPAQGEIVLEASHTSSEVLITISDDGAGMDPQVLLRKGREKGILTKPEEEYTDKEALGLIMLPGFSTNQTVTEFSGRGVGMDVVKKNVESVGGVVSLSSEKGKGTTFTLKIPLTLSIVDGMKIRVGSSIFTIPIADIRQSFKITRDQIILDDSGNEMVERMSNFYPVVRLHQFYNLNTDVTSVEDGILIWVESGEHSFCLFVDDLIGQQQVVLKPFPTYLNSLELKNYGISGCTILGDGNISIILDTLSLYTAAIENR